jgi:6-phosphogluconolactonase
MLKVFSSADELIAGLANFVVERAEKSIQEHGRFNLVLSGGSSPKRLYELLATDGYRKRIDWSKVYFFFGDERNVPSDHPDSNYLMVKRSLFIPLGIKDDHVFPIDTSHNPDYAADVYEKQIRNHFNNGPCRFDLILLGLGDNSHTASLFPHTAIVHEKTALVKEVYVQEVNMYRITFTAPLINDAHAVAFLVYGSSKAEAVHHILDDDVNVDSYPAQLIKPSPGEIYWFLDEAAASKLVK